MIHLDEDDPECTPHKPPPCCEPDNDNPIEFLLRKDDKRPRSPVKKGPSSQRPAFQKQTFDDLSELAGCTCLLSSAPVPGTSKLQSANDREEQKRKTEIIESDQICTCDAKSGGSDREKSKDEPKSRNSNKKRRGGLFRWCKKGKPAKRLRWKNEIEFLFTMLSMSIGLGNIWRFPMVMYENGRGTFLLIYLFMLLTVANPLVVMELFLGKFTGMGCIGVWECVPLLKGIGYSQLVVASFTVIYYVALMAIAFVMLILSFASELPWWHCHPFLNCSQPRLPGWTPDKIQSEFFFINKVISEQPDLTDGIGLPNWKLSLSLLFTWFTLALVLVHGIRLQAAVSYFLTMFPFLSLVVLLVRAASLPGARHGIVFYFTPVWEEFFNPKVWFAASTQVFYSLGIGFGSLIASGSYSKAREDIIGGAVTIIIFDTIASIIAALSVMSVVGSMSRHLNKDVWLDTPGRGPSLPFVALAEAAVHFDVIPQFFSILFFLMMFSFGFGGALSLLRGIVKGLSDRYQDVKDNYIVVVVCTLFFLIGLIYLTPGGLALMRLFDYFSVALPLFVIVSFEVLAMFCIYGYKRLCSDMTFLLGRKFGRSTFAYLGYVLPYLTMASFLYSISYFVIIRYRGRPYPPGILSLAWCAMAVVVLPILTVAIYKFSRKKGKALSRLKATLSPDPLWGPTDPKLNAEWRST